MKSFKKEEAQIRMLTVKDSNKVQIKNIQCTYYYNYIYKETKITKQWNKWSIYWKIKY